MQFKEDKENKRANSISLDPHHAPYPTHQMSNFAKSSQKNVLLPVWRWHYSRHLQRIIDIHPIIRSRQSRRRSLRSDDPHEAVPERLRTNCRILRDLIFGVGNGGVQGFFDEAALLEEEIFFPGLVFGCPAECGLFQGSFSEFSDCKGVFLGGRGRLTFMMAALSVSTFARVVYILALVAFQIATISGLVRYCRSMAKRVTLASLAFARGAKLKRAVSSAKT